MHEACLMLGSNIDPIEHLQKALALLREHGEITRMSTTWETTAVGSPGPNFYNLAICLHTPLSSDDLKWQVLRSIESRLGRIRTADKNAPRTIDLDIIVYDGEVLDPQLWKRFFVTIPMAELLPDLRNPSGGQWLHEIAKEFKARNQAIPHPELAALIK